MLITVETKVVPTKEFMTKYHDINYWAICIYNLIVLCKNMSNTHFKVFGLTRPGLELMIYRTRGKYVYHYATDVVLISWCIMPTYAIFQRYEVGHIDYGRNESCSDQGIYDEISRY
jgi:hypothetical protein